METATYIYDTGDHVHDFSAEKERNRAAAIGRRDAEIARGAPVREWNGRQYLACEFLTIHPVQTDREGPNPPPPPVEVPLTACRAVLESSLTLDGGMEIQVRGDRERMGCARVIDEGFRVAKLGGMDPLKDETVPANVRDECLVFSFLHP